MWLMTTRGFYSVVEHRDDADRLLVRARTREDIEALAGLVAAAAVTRVMATLLFGVSPLDPLTFAAVALGLVATTLLASYLPARRAARIDPINALRAD